MDRVTVIIPAYNVEHYISECLDSVLASENENLQVIVVDDGSVDNTLAICQRYSQQDERVTVIHKNNGGVSSARNAAMPYINGQRVCFLDADDQITPDFLSIDSLADVIEKSYDIIKEDGNVFHVEPHFENIGSKKSLCHYFVNYRLNALWNKIISADIVKEHRFDENFSNGEDMFFFLSLLPEIKSYEFSSSGKYMYFERRNSATMRRLGKRELWKNYNFACIDKLANDDDKTTLYVRKAILYGTYICDMYLILKELNTDQKATVLEHLKKMKWRDLQLLPLRRKLRLFEWHILSKYKT